MEQWLDIQGLIWLFPNLFIFHDFEEIIIMEKWLNKYLWINKIETNKLASILTLQFSRPLQHT